MGEENTVTTLGGDGTGGEPGTATADAIEAQTLIDQYTNPDGATVDDFSKALHSREHPMHDAAVALKNQTYDRAAQRHPDPGPENRREAARNAQAELDWIGRGGDPQLVVDLSDPESPRNAAAKERWANLYAATAAVLPEDTDIGDELSRYGRPLEDDERKGHVSLPDRLPSMDNDEATAAVGAVEGAYWNRNHPRHAEAVRRVTQVYEQRERWLDGEDTPAETQGQIDGLSDAEWNALVRDARAARKTN